MSIAPIVQRELLRSGADFQLVRHHAAYTSAATAHAARVAPAHLAKSVVVRDDVGYVVAVIPADSRLDLTPLRARLGRALVLAKEWELPLMFHDCRYGAIPPLGFAYGIETWFDERLAEMPYLYFEAGDHELLVRMQAQDFLRLAQPVNYGRFSSPLTMAARRRSLRERTHPSPPASPASPSAAPH